MMRSSVSLRWLVAAVLALFGALGVLTDRVFLPRQSASVRAEWLAENGRFEEAESLYWKQLEQGPVTTPLLIAFLDVHAHAPARHGRPGAQPWDDGFTTPKAPRVHDEAIEELLQKPDLPADAALLGRFWRGALARKIDPADRKDVEAAADRDAPMPWANRLLARDELLQGNVDAAARRFAREAMFVPEHGEDADRALRILFASADWDGASELLRDARFAAAAGAYAKFRYAVERRDWPSAARWSFGATFHTPELPVLALTIAAALAWFSICARLGNVRERPLVKIPLYLASFALGVFSVYPTMVLVTLQTVFLHLEQTGDMTRDALYFFFGVGFREELSKLLLFLPIYPLVRKTGDKLDVLVAGSMVGLGFAAEENLGYFAQGSLATATARYMTANFAHMAWTGVAALALDDMVRDKERYTFDFSKTLVIVMATHGAYDFFLTTHIDGLSYFSMAVFIVTGRQFMGALKEARPRVGRGIPALNVFAIATAVVVGSSFVYASARVGPNAAALVMLEGLIGTFIFTFFFVQEFRRL